MLELETGLSEYQTGLEKTQMDESMWDNVK